MRKLLLLLVLVVLLNGCAKKIDYGESVVFVSDLKDGVVGSGTAYGRRSLS